MVPPSRDTRNASGSIDREPSPTYSAPSGPKRITPAGSIPVNGAHDHCGLTESSVDLADPHQERTRLVGGCLDLQRVYQVRLGKVRRQRD